MPPCPSLTCYGSYHRSIFTSSFASANSHLSKSIPHLIKANSKRDLHSSFTQNNYSAQLSANRLFVTVKLRRSQVKVHLISPHIIMPVAEQVHIHIGPSCICLLEHMVKIRVHTEWTTQLIHLIKHPWWNSCSK